MRCPHVPCILLNARSPITIIITINKPSKSTTNRQENATRHIPAAVVSSLASPNCVNFSKCRQTLAVNACRPTKNYNLCDHIIIPINATYVRTQFAFTASRCISYQSEAPQVDSLVVVLVTMRSICAPHILPYKSMSDGLNSEWNNAMIYVGTGYTFTVCKCVISVQRIMKT